MGGGVTEEAMRAQFERLNDQSNEVCEIGEEEEDEMRVNLLTEMEEAGISVRDSTMVSLPPQLTRSSTLSPITFSGILKSQSETTQRATGINTTMPDPSQAATCSRCATPNATLEAKSSRTTHTITFPTTPSTEHAPHI